ncbi:hypothetical protein H7F33_05500 [Pedobacter sp. PAMC26386]|nr:hypothetical protein H7F33_05500 [Pedobacter sp. PAMC26386]
MESISIELEAADTLLDKGVPLPVTAPLLFRIFGKKTITLILKHPFLDTAVRAGSLYLQVQEMGLETENVTEGIRLREKSAGLIARIIAIIILRNRFPDWLERLLAFYLKRHVAEKTLYNITNVVVCSGISDFLNTIRLTSHLRMTRPNLSPTEKRS